MQVQAKGRFIRISPRKVRKVGDAVKGSQVETGLNQLRFMPQKAAALLEKLVRSALANAEQQGDVDVDTLMIKNIIVDQGPSLKRWRPRAQGRATRILKRTSHITVVLGQ